LGIAATSGLYWIGNFDGLHASPKGSRYAKQFRDDPQDISEPLSKNFPCELRALAGVMPFAKEKPRAVFDRGLF